MTNEWDRAAAQIEAELAAIKNEFAAQRERYASLDGLGVEFAAIKNELAAQRERYASVDRLGVEFAAIKNELAVQRERYASLDRLGVEFAAIKNELATQRERYASLDRLGSEFGAIKNELASLRTSFTILRNRQVIPLDGEMLAIRHEMGWIITLQEDYAFALHFADGAEWHENGTVEVMRHFVQEGNYVVDLGAHIGLHTLTLARVVGPKGSVVAVEPFPRTAECLRRALISNDLQARCEVIVGAAGDANGLADFYVGNNSMLGSLFPIGNDSKIEVREFRLDDYVGTDRKVDFVKIDVEGGELRALEGMRELIARNDDIAVLVEFGRAHLERVGLEPRDWFNAFASTGLSIYYRIEEPTGVLLPVDLDYVPDLGSYNILFVKNPERAAGYMKSLLKKRTTDGVEEREQGQQAQQRRAEPKDRSGSAQSK